MNIPTTSTANAKPHRGEAPAIGAVPRGAGAVPPAATGVGGSAADTDETDPSVGALILASRVARAGAVEPGAVAYAAPGPIT